MIEHRNPCGVKVASKVSFVGINNFANPQDFHYSNEKGKILTNHPLLYYLKITRVSMEN